METETESTETTDDAVSNLKAELSSVREEAARYRVQRNDALKQNAALTAVVSAHNIDFDIARADLDNLKVDHGKVVGEFEYEPSTETRRDMTNPNTKPDDLGRSDIEQMTAEQIKAIGIDKAFEALKG